MVWVRLADDFTDHPKVVAAGPLAGWLYVCGLTYSNRYLTDGFIPSGQVRRMADVDDAMGLVERLVKVGLWEAVEGGYRIHDYHGYQPSAKDVKREREEAAQRQAEYRARKRNGSSNGVTNGERLGAPYPARPVPGPGNPAPAVSSPQPPPQAEGEPPPTPRKRGERAGQKARTNGVAAGGSQEAKPLQEPQLAPADDRDWRVWNLARGQLAEFGLTAGNVEAVGLLVPVGRSADGGLRLRAPPGMGLARFGHHVARALSDAGDQHAERVTIFESIPDSEGS